MAKKKKKSLNVADLVMTIVIMVLAVLTICTLFIPVIKSTTLATKLSISANGADVFTSAFAGEFSNEMSEGAKLLYGYKTAEETAAVTNIFMWTYMITVVVAVATLVFATLRLLGMKFKLINTVLGAVLILLALVAFIFAIVVAAKNTEVTEALGQKIGIKTLISASSYFLLGTIVAGGTEIYLARKK